MATYAEPVRSYEAVLSDQGNISYESVTLANGAGSLTAGSVLGKKTVVQAAAPIPTIVGTGSGLMSALSFGPDVQVGSYVVTMLATSATAAFSESINSMFRPTYSTASSTASTGTPMSMATASGVSPLSIMAKQTVDARMRRPFKNSCVDADCGLGSRWCHRSLFIGGSFREPWAHRSRQ